jgi:hypothetical protein
MMGNILLFVKVGVVDLPKKEVIHPVTGAAYNTCIDIYISDTLNIPFYVNYEDSASDLVEPFVKQYNLGPYQRAQIIEFIHKNLGWFLFFLFFLFIYLFYVIFFVLIIIYFIYYYCPVVIKTFFLVLENRHSYGLTDNIYGGAFGSVSYGVVVSGAALSPVLRVKEIIIPGPSDGGVFGIVEGHNGVVSMEYAHDKFSKFFQNDLKAALSMLQKDMLSDVCHVICLFVIIIIIIIIFYLYLKMQFFFFFFCFDFRDLMRTGLR